MPSFLSVFVDTFFSLFSLSFFEYYNLAFADISKSGSFKSVSSMLIRDKVLFECHDFRRF